MDTRTERLQEAIELAGKTHTLADVVQAIDDKRAILWAGEDSVIVTEIRQAPRKKTLNIWLAGGELHEVMELADKAMAWAKTEGCTAATIAGRKGWERIGRERGWQHQATVIAKEI